MYPFRKYTMPSPDKTNPDLIDVHPAPPSKVLPKKLISLCCFSYPRKRPKTLPVLDPRYRTFEAFAASNSNPNPLPPARTRQATFKEFNTGSIGSYSSFPTPVFEYDDRKRHARYDFYPSGACREQAGWHPHGKKVFEASTAASVRTNTKQKGRERELIFPTSTAEADTPLDVESGAKLRQHRLPADGGDEPQRIVTDHFLSFTTSTTDDNNDEVSNIHRPTLPLPCHLAHCDRSLAKNQQCHLCRIASEGKVFRHP